jgi:16S rRNA (cytidine1402-2'-O)-methyltransferase
MAIDGKRPVLYLFPSVLGDTSPHEVLSGTALRTIKRIRHFVVEDVRTSRRLLRAIDRKIDIDGLIFHELNEHTQEEEIPGLLQPLKDGFDLGLLSEAGLPCIADPGSRLVSYAHKAGFSVRPFPGPSSIYLALMASGFNGQAFVFHGYLPVSKSSRTRKIREMESDILKNGRTQLFIETPYRNNQLLKSLVETCKDPMLLCVAINLTTPEEKVVVKSIGEWKRSLPELHKQPAVFLLYH